LCLHTGTLTNSFYYEKSFRDLGFSEIGIRAPEKTKAFLYISQKRIVGLLLAEAITQGHKMFVSEGKNTGTPVHMIDGLYSLAV
jgi:hypothetical protein